jgi:hypothetical protein
MRLQRNICRDGPKADINDRYEHGELCYGNSVLRCDIVPTLQRVRSDWSASDLIGPGYLGAKAIWPLVNPTVVALPLGILGAVVGSLLARGDAELEKRFGEVTFRIQTGLRSNRP